MSKLTSLIRQKYPGAYDDLDDSTLEKQILAKYPQYKDLAVPEEDPVNDAKKFLDTTNNRPDNVNNQSTPQTAPEEGWLMRAWHGANKPLLDSKYTPAFIPKPVGEFISSLTSPMNLAMTAATAGESSGIPAVAKIASYLSKGLAVPTGLEGLSKMEDSNESTGSRLSGLLQAGLSVLPFIHGAPKIAREEPKPNILDNVNTTTGEILDKPLSAPNPTAGTPSFGGRGKPTGSRQAGTTITIKPGAGLDEIQPVLDGGYKLSHQTPDGSYVFVSDPAAPITETQVAKAGKPTQAGARRQLGPETDTKKNSAVAEVMNMPRAIMASVDMSAPLRQGLPLIHKKEFRQALWPMIKSFGSEEAFQEVQRNIAAKSVFKRGVDAAGKELPSFAEQAGLKLTDLHDLSNREEALMSSWLEKVPGFGKLYRGSERSYTAFLNKLRADTFENLVKDAQVLNPDSPNNLVAARGLAKFVNTATGRGSLGALEQSATNLNSIFFAPRLIASRMQMLNPVYYVNLPPQARKEALKSLLAVTTFGNTIGQLGRMAGAEVENNPNSSDFGKVKIGNIRLDPWAGFQQYIVAANRILRPESWHTDLFQDAMSKINPINLAEGVLDSPGGHMKSTITGHDYELGTLPVGSNRFDIAERFIESKTNPLISLATAILRGKDITGKKVDVPEQVANRFIPIFIQDLKQLATENPNMLPYRPEGTQEGSYSEFHPENLPFAIPAWFGMGVQQYGPK